MPKFKPNPSAFRMSGYSYPGTSPLLDEKKVIKTKETAKEEELVPYTSPNKPKDWGSSNVDPYETLISPQTKRLIEAGAPKEVIKKSKKKKAAK